MTSKNILLVALVVAVLVVAFVLILRLTNVISQENMTDVLTKAGWTLLILTIAAEVISLIKTSNGTK